MKSNLFYDSKRVGRKDDYMNPIVVRNIKIGQGIPKICVPIVEKTEENILRAAREIVGSPADLVEWRVDWFESVFDIEKVKKVAEDLRQVLGNMPLLFTFRTKNEGGEKKITFEQYTDILCQVADTNTVDMIDVEVFANENTREFVTSLKEKGVVVVGSNHDFTKTPSKDEIVQRLCYMQEVGADISKIAVMPQNAKDVLTLLCATEEMASMHPNTPVVTMSMAGLGALSRLSGEVFGSAITFGALQKASAPGQIPVKELSEMLKVLHRQ